LERAFFTPEGENNPVTRRDGKLFVKFDEIRLEERGSRRIWIEFYLKGERIGNLEHPPYIDFRSGESLSIQSLQGLLSLTIT
jgi:hypothetical protein